MAVNKVATVVGSMHPDNKYCINMLIKKLAQRTTLTRYDKLVIVS